MGYRLEPLSDAEWPAEAARLRDGFAGRLNVYRLMAHHPALLLAWENFRNHVVLGSALSPQQSEIVILRVGVRRQSRYEWMHHVLRGLDAGLTPDRIRSAQVPDPAPDRDEDSLLMAAVDAIIDQGLLPPTLLARATAAVGPAGVLDIIATVGLYTTLAAILGSYDVPAEPATLAAFAASPLADPNHG